ncbi:MAG: ABC transporter ATP-binding protein/permease [Drouetiella hepatica Uher 2000/2452]|uniref:ABC transporter ATP-binding protein/permease n=1 Tax=Drouetiella hepatica Uher 2000/2452 TaxID=904376 RepID=A0A951QF65_9CYAN|nr:ABC transporter ATP-binding protein/permease [Drouetiella hepatica Uher 2000/2452]
MNSESTPAKRQRPKDIKAALPGLRRIVERFSPQIRKQGALLTFSVIGLFVEVLARLLEPWPLKLIFDNIIVPGASATPSSIPWLSNVEPNMLLIGSALAIIGVASIQAGAAYISMVGMSLAASRIVTEIRATLYAHLQQLSLSFHYRAKGGDLITRITSDIDRLRDVTVTAAVPLFVNLVTLVGMVGVMFFMDWELALIAVAIFPIFIISTVKITKRIHSIARQQRKREGAMAATAAEAMGAIKVVQALSLESMLEDMFSKENEKSLEEVARTQQLSAGLQRTVELLVSVATALVLWRGVHLVMQGSATAGDLLVFINYLKTAYRPTRQLAKQMAMISKATASGERIIDLLDVVPDIRDRKGAIAAPPFRGGVKFKNISFAYEPEKLILQDLSFEVKPGQRVALVGASGGGKSTLVSLLLRLYDPTAGQIQIDGRDLRDYKVASLRQQISVVLQDSILFGVSVRDNIAYGSLGASNAQIEAAAQLANAHDFITALPQGYDTLLGERGATLSGGQRQRIAIARAAIRKAPIIILDEPTVGLDNENEQAVTEALRRLAQGSTTFLITHDLRAATDADLICYVEAGKILESGTHLELLRLGKRYSALYQIQNAIGDQLSQKNPLAQKP